MEYSLKIGICSCGGRKKEFHYIFRKVWKNFDHNQNSRFTWEYMGIPERTELNISPYSTRCHRDSFNVLILTLWAPVLPLGPILQDNTISSHSYGSVYAVYSFHIWNLIFFLPYLCFGQSLRLSRNFPWSQFPCFWHKDHLSSCSALSLCYLRKGPTVNTS